jgi:hypothetical protein
MKVDSEVIQVQLVLQFVLQYCTIAVLSVLYEWPVICWAALWTCLVINQRLNE